MRKILGSVARSAVRFANRSRILGRQHSLVLMYHRVACPASDPWTLSVSPKHFAEHLCVLRDWAVTKTFADLAASLEAPDRPQRSVAITFDDGYFDNLEAAYPLLTAQDVPATVFVTSGAIGADCNFWWDALARVFLETQQLPSALRLEANGSQKRWDLGAAAACSENEMRELAACRLTGQTTDHPRMQLLNRVWRTLFEASTTEAEELCTKIVVWAGLDRAGPPTERAMRPAELQQLSSSGLIEVGAHTVSHPPLDRLDPVAAAAEISRSRMALAEIIGRDVKTFAYPFGRFGRETPRLVQSAGFKAACTVAERVAITNVNPFRIPRITVRDCDGDAFARTLRLFAGI